jgi:isopentenyldiphosphate isomerase
MEILEIVHEHSGEPTGAALPRKEAIEQKAWCRSTNVYVLNHAGEVLCHQRSLQKERLPGYWMTHLGGHVGQSETYETNAVKELEEEAGIIADPLHLISWRTTRKEESRLWMRDFVTLQDVALEDLVPQPGEVETFAWKTPQEIIKEAKHGGKWKAGTHHFHTEYHCLRAVLSAAQAHGLIPAPAKTHIWHHIHAEG